MQHPSVVLPICPVDQLSKQHANPVAGDVARGMEERHLPQKFLNKRWQARPQR